MKKYSYYDIRNSFELWQKYVDPQASVSKADFDSMTEEEKIVMQTKVLGEEPVNYWIPGLKEIRPAGQEEDPDKRQAGI